MLLLTHKPKPISLARQRRDSLETSSSESCNSREHLSEWSIVVDLGTNDDIENCMILLDDCLENMGVEEFKNFRDKLIESGLNKDLLPPKYLL